MSRPGLHEWAGALCRHRHGLTSGPACGHCHFAALDLDSLIERERQAAREEGMAAVAGPVLALAEEFDRHDFTLECTDGGHPCRECNTAEAFRAAIPTDAAEALAQVRAEAWDEGYRSGHSNAMRRMSDEPNAPTTSNPYRAAAHEAGS